MKLQFTRSKVIIIAVASVVILCAICIPIGIVVHNNNKNNDDGDNSTTTHATTKMTTTNGVTTTPSHVEESIVRDLKGTKDTMNKFKDDVDNLVRTLEAKIFREDVEFMKSTSTK
jgi:uncharacterized protein YoxC